MKALGSNLIFIGAYLDLYRCYYNPTNTDYTTALVYDFSGNSNPFFNQTVDQANEIFLEYNNKLYFAARESISPTNTAGGKVIQIYATNGVSAQVVVPITNLEFQPYSGNFVFNLSVYENKLYFTMYDFPNFSYHLWKANPNNGVYEQLSFPNTITNPAKIAFEHNQVYNSLKWFNNSLYMSAFTTAEEKELWKFTDNANLAILENDSNKNLTIFPNPPTDSFNIYNDNLNEFTLEILDLSGKRMDHFRNKKQVDLSNYASGIYLLKITDLPTNKIIIKKVVKH